MLVHIAALVFVNEDSQIERLMTDGKLARNLPGAPVAADIGLNALPKTVSNDFGIGAIVGARSTDFRQDYSAR